MIICYNTGAYVTWYSPIQCYTYLHRNKKYPQVFVSDFGWVCVYLMKTKGEAHKALNLMFQREGVPPTMVMDGSKEQTLGKFFWKLVDAHCQLKQTEL